jgi:PEP-CTERM motif
MKKFALMTVAVAALLIAPTTAQAQVSCTAATAMTSFAGYVSCAGAYTGNINGSAGELTQLTSLFGGTWTWAGKSDDAGFGPFTSSPATTTSGMITFDALVTGKFVVGVKAGTGYSFYQFDGGIAGILSVPYETIGAAVNGNGIPLGASHVALYRGPMNVVPEPSTYALLGTGLLSLGAVARRRRSQA